MYQQHESNAIIAFRRLDALIVATVDPTRAQTDDDIVGPQKVSGPRWTKPSPNPLCETWKNTPFKIAGKPHNRLQRCHLASSFDEQVKRMPWRIVSRRTQVLPHNFRKLDFLELLSHQVQPTESDPACRTIQTLDLSEDLERHALDPGYMLEVIEMSQDILDLEPASGLANELGRRCFTPVVAVGGQGGVVIRHRPYAAPCPM
ncbi:MAG: hypothetical protein ACRD9W_02765, partial [Terriglobia bacterium]